MTAERAAAPGVAPAASRRSPPVTEIAVVAMALVLVSGIYLASSLPRQPSLAPAVILVAVAAGLLVLDGGLLARLRPFAWATFFVVARWALAAYAVIAGVLMFVFVRDGTTGGPLALLIASLALFAVTIPLILGFTVAHYAARPEAPDAGGDGH
jgi:hypothetical protein